MFYKHKRMNQEEILNEIISNKELIDSPLLLSWIQESKDNHDAFIAYKNRQALLQTGAEMSEQDILKDLRVVKKAFGKSKSYSLKNTFLKYAVILALVIIGGYAYHLTSINPSPQITMNEISVPKGSRSHILLPDGSEVVLINGSKVVYQSSFNKKMREVYLEGEAYFIIAHDRANPFKVHLGDHEIEVLGTEFLVTAYPQDELLKVDLVTGRVTMNVAKSKHGDFYDSYSLEPCENLVLNTTNRNVQVEKNKDDFYRFWKEGEYRFNKESFGSLAHKLERIYRLPIKFEDQALESCEFTGAFYANSTIVSILDVFQKASSIPFEYKIINKVIYIKTF